MKVVAVSADAVSRLSRPPSRAKKEEGHAAVGAVLCAQLCAYLRLFTLEDLQNAT